MVTADLIDTLSRFGAIGGILSIVGVGLLILLVASQSRQIRSMKDWIDEEPQRQQETAQRVIAEVQRRIAAARERRAVASVAPPGGIPRAKPAPGTLGATPEAQAIAAQQEDVPAAVGAGIDAPTEVQSPPGFTPATVGGGAEAPAFAPLTPAGDDEAAPEVDGDDDGEPAVVAEFGQETQLSEAVPSEFPPAVPAARGRDLRFSDDHFDLDDEEPPKSNRLLFGIGAGALLAGIVLAGILLFGGDSADTGTKAKTPSSKSQTNADGGQANPPAPTTIDPSTVNVQVFNGTQITGLAKRVTQTLQAAGYAMGAFESFTSTPSRETTSVYFRPNNRAAAVKVADDLGLGSSAVSAITPDVSAAAGQGTTKVVVVTGADLDTGAGSTTG